MTLLAGCTGGGGGSSGAPHSASNGPVSQSPSGPSSPSRSSDVVLVVATGFGAMASDPNRPRKLAKLVHARDCVDWLDIRLRGAASYEVHLRVRRTDALNAKRSLTAVLGGPTLVGVHEPGPGNPVKVETLSAFDTPPTNMGPQPLRQTC